MLEKLRTLNNELIEYYKNDEVNLKKQHLIKQLLADKNCFFKMKIETAYSILKDLNLSQEEVESTYLKLIDIENYEEL